MFRKVVFLWLMFCTASLSAFGGKIECGNGQFFSDSKNKCEDCPGNMFDPFYCAALTLNNKPNDGHNYFNIKTCPTGQWFKKSEKKCVNGDKQECDAGYYLKDDESGTCTGCGNLAGVRNTYLNWINNENEKTKSMWAAIKNQYGTNDDYPIKFIASDIAIASFYCPKVQNTIKQYDLPWGIKVCPTGQVASADTKSCVTPSSNTSITCQTGEYLPGGTTKCVRCSFDRKTGKYCPGGTFAFDASKDQGVKTCAKGTQIVSNNGQSCVTCPSGKSKDYTECEQLEDNSAMITVLVSEPKSCEPGSYLMSKSEYIGRLKDNSSQSSLGNQTTSLKQVPYCMSCFDYGTNYSGLRCPGVSKTLLKDTEQGKYYCNNGQVTTRENPTTCIDKPGSSVTCAAGEYLPGNKVQKCVSCKGLGNVYCPGNTYKPSAEAQGYFPCRDTYVPDSDYAKCVCPSGQVEENNKCVTPIMCVAGQIWNSQAGKCEACTSKAEWINYAEENRMYCPGVRDTNLPVLQQLKKCPNGAWPNASLTDCDCRWGTKDGDTCKNMSISANDLQYGPNGKSAPLFKQCWTKSTPATYKKCMGFDD